MLFDRLSPLSVLLTFEDWRLGDNSYAVEELSAEWILSKLWLTPRYILDG